MFLKLTNLVNFTNYDLAKTLLIEYQSQTISGTEGQDTIYGRSGDDYLYGNGGHDNLYGGAGADTLVGGEGNDLLNGGVGADKLIGGNGSDAADYTGSAAGVYVNLQTGRSGYGDAEGDTYSSIDDLVGSKFRDTLVGDAGNNALVGGDNWDVLKGGDGNDWLFGYDVAHMDTYDGGNEFYAGNGRDFLYGAGGADTFHFSVNDHGEKFIANFSRDQGDKIDAVGLGPYGRDFTITASTYFADGTDLIYGDLVVHLAHVQLTHNDFLV